MKFMLATLSLSLCSFGESISNPTPDATELDSDLYTIQFTLVELSDDFKMPTPWTETNNTYTVTGYSVPPNETEVTQYESTLINPAPPDSNPGISELILLSNPSYTSFATVHVAPGEEFSSPNGEVKGTFDLKNRLIRNLQIKFMDRELPVGGLAIRNTWHSMMFSGYPGTDGARKDYALMIKSYPPQK